MTQRQEDYDLTSVCHAIGRSQGACLLEGLPHQYFERDLLEEERQSKKVRQVGGFPFYQEPLMLSLIHI